MSILTITISARVWCIPHVRSSSALDANCCYHTALRCARCVLSAYVHPPAPLQSAVPLRSHRRHLRTTTRLPSATSLISQIVALISMSRVVTGLNRHSQQQQQHSASTRPLTLSDRFAAIASLPSAPLPVAVAPASSSSLPSSHFAQSLSAPTNPRYHSFTPSTAATPSLSARFQAARFSGSRNAAASSNGHAQSAPQSAPSSAPAPTHVDGARRPRELTLKGGQKVAFGASSATTARVARQVRLQKETRRTVVERKRVEVKPRQPKPAAAAPSRVPVLPPVVPASAFGGAGVFGGGGMGAFPPFMPGLAGFPAVFSPGVVAPFVGADAGAGRRGVKGRGRGGKAVGAGRKALPGQAASKGNGGQPRGGKKAARRGK